MQSQRLYVPLFKASRLNRFSQRGLQRKSSDVGDSGEPADQHMDLYDSSPRQITDLLVRRRSEHLDLTVAPYLPSKPTQVEDNTPQNNKLPPGHHFVYFPTSSSELDTLQDGYEKHFAPSWPYRRRLWVTGQLKFQGDGLRFGCLAECRECLTKVRRGEKGTNIWIERTMYNQNDGPTKWSIIERRCLRYIHDLSSVSPPDDTTEGPVRDKSTLNNTNQPLRHTFVPSQILLTRFSYLTYNFHRIHIDHEYATKIEGYPGTLMHGSLSIVLLLTAFRNHYYLPDKRIYTVTYSMYRPLYVDRPATLTLEPAQKGNTRGVLWDDGNKKAVECYINTKVDISNDEVPASLYILLRCIFLIDLRNLPSLFIFYSRIRRQVLPYPF